MPLWNPLPSVFQNPDHLSANLTTVGTPLRPASILAECLLRFLAEFPVTGLGRFRHTVLRLPPAFDEALWTCYCQASWAGTPPLAQVRLIVAHVAEPSDTAPVRKHAASDGGFAATSQIGATAIFAP